MYMRKIISIGALGLNDLPSEMLMEKIFPYLSIGQLISLSEVNRHLNGVVACYMGGVESDSHTLQMLKYLSNQGFNSTKDLSKLSLRDPQLRFQLSTFIECLGPDPSEWVATLENGDLPDLIYLGQNRLLRRDPTTLFGDVAEGISTTPCWSAWNCVFKRNSESSGLNLISAARFDRRVGDKTYVFEGMEFFCESGAYQGNYGKKTVFFTEPNENLHSVELQNVKTIVSESGEDLYRECGYMKQTYKYPEFTVVVEFFGIKLDLYDTILPGEPDSIRKTTIRGERTEKIESWSGVEVMRLGMIGGVTKAP